MALPLTCWINSTFPLSPGSAFPLLPGGEAAQERPAAGREHADCAPEERRRKGSRSLCQGMDAYPPNWRSPEEAVARLERASHIPQAPEIHKPDMFGGEIPFPRKDWSELVFPEKEPDKSAFFCWNIFLVQICGWEYPSVKASSGRYLNKTGKGICFLKVASRC